MRYLKRNQSKFLRKRLSTKSRLRNALEKREKAAKIGKPCKLPASHYGSPRHLHKLFKQAMAICRDRGKPDFFITMTVFTLKLQIFFISFLGKSISS